MGVQITLHFNKWHLWCLKLKKKKNGEGGEGEGRKNAYLKLLRVSSNNKKKRELKFIFNHYQKPENQKTLIKTKNNIHSKENVENNTSKTSRPEKKGGRGRSECVLLVCLSWCCWLLEKREKTLCFCTCTLLAKREKALSNHESETKSQANIQKNSKKTFSKRLSLSSLSLTTP